mgnify:CR=1 FL=1
MIPLLGVWDKPEDIDLDSLPNQFVLKVNWGSGQNIIVKDKKIKRIQFGEILQEFNYIVDDIDEYIAEQRNITR